MQGGFPFNHYMRKILISLTLLIAGMASAQTDSLSMSDILKKLNNLEKMKSTNDTLSSIKVITDRGYAEQVNNKTTVVKKINVGVQQPVTENIIDTTVLQPVIHFDTAAYNLGSITQGDIARQKFTFINKGTDDLEILDVAADCSCTSPDWSKGPIKPGGTGYVIATYDSKEDMGNFMKTVTVIHNSGKGYTFLEIKGFVAPKL